MQPKTINHDEGLTESDFNKKSIYYTNKELTPVSIVLQSEIRKLLSHVT